MRRFQRPRVLLVLGVFVVAAVVFCLTPLLVANGVRGWIWWAAWQEGLTASVARVEAPLFRPVVIHQLRLRSGPERRPTTDVEIDRAEFGMNLAAIITRSPERRIRALSIDGARVTLRAASAVPAKSTPANWSPLNRVFADTFRIAHLDIRVEWSGAIAEAHDVALTASEVESGKFSVGECTVASPFLSQRFSQLRGATSWQNQRLTVGAITLARGLDIDAITADFSHLALQRVGLEMNVDVFGGKVRANVTTESRDRGRLWDIAGTATDISLAQMAETMSTREPATGALRACKFTFRGSATDLAHSTASIWGELGDFAWGQRNAESVMLGASLHNRRVHLEQFYVKQRDNQFTLSGDVPWTTHADDWLKPDVNIGLSAMLKDVGAFARLFGAQPDVYAGQITVEGAMGVEDRKRRGELSANGDVQLRGARLLADSRATANIICRGATASFNDAAVEHGDTTVHLRGDVDFGDLRQIAARFYPSERYAEVTAAASGSCVSGFSLAPAAASEASNSTVREIDLRGGLLTSEWNIAVLQGSDTPGDQPTERNFRFCPANPSATSLRLVGIGR